MKKILTIAIIMMACANASAQVVFNKWKVKHGMFTSYYILEVQYTVTSEKPIKYMTYGHYSVNEVGDAVMSQRKVLDPTPVGYYQSLVKATGPFEKGKKYKRYHDPAAITPVKIAMMPSVLKFEYMDGTEEEIEITKDNVTQFFPTVKWQDYTVPNVVQE